MLEQSQQGNSRERKDRFLQSPLLYLALILIALFAVYCLFYSGSASQEPSQFLAQVVPSKNTSPVKAPYFFLNSAFMPQIASLTIIDQGFLQSSGPPFLVKGQVLGALASKEGDFLSYQNETKEYIVKQGDTLSGIARQFGISLETVLWANNLSSRSVIQPGQKMVILPVSGVMHIVRKGETLSQIAQTYQAKLEDVVQFNGLKSPDDIFAGDMLILPNATMPKRAPSYPRVALPKTAFICPIPKPCHITQGLHWFNAVDFSNGKCGEPVYAAATGRVQRTGYNRIAGNYVRIIHDNGVVTFYGHLSQIATRPGVRVSQGQIIGYTGHTGHTVPAGPAGCHLHFDVRFAANPFAKY